MVERILCFALAQGRDVVAYAVKEGEPDAVLAAHWSSSVDFAKFDIGLTSPRKHELYRAACPRGFELVWIDHPKEHPLLASRISSTPAGEVEP